MRFRTALSTAFVLVAGLALAGCSGSGPPPFEGLPVRVVCTTTIVTDVVQRVGGDRVTIETLMGPGSDPHTYLPTPGDPAKLEAAHLVFFNGLHLEGKMTDTFEKGRGRFRAFAVTRDLDHSVLRPADVDGGEFDPHVWFDVSLWAKTIPVIAKELSNLDPAGAETYRRNTDNYSRELADLEREIRGMLNRVPADKRVLVTSHDAFGYFGRAYGFEVRGLQGVSTASETSTGDRQKLAEFLGKRKIPAVFAETSVVSEGLKAVLDTCRDDWKHSVRLISGDDALYSDALGPAGSPGATYAGMVRHNAGVIVNALAK